MTASREQGSGRAGERAVRGAPLLVRVFGLGTVNENFTKSARWFNENFAEAKIETRISRMEFGPPREGDRSCL